MAVAEFVPKIARFRSYLVGCRDAFLAADCVKHGEVGCVRIVEAGEQAVNGVDATPRFSGESRVNPLTARTLRLSQADSSALTTVVPTAMTGRSSRCAELTAAADLADTVNGSA